LEAALGAPAFRDPPLALPLWCSAVVLVSGTVGGCVQLHDAVAGGVLLRQALHAGPVTSIALRTWRMGERGVSACVRALTLVTRNQRIVQKGGSRLLQALCPPSAVCYGRNTLAIPRRFYDPLRRQG
jgi:hypothetical protein